MRIVLADDSEAMRSVYRQVLARTGYASGAALEARDWNEVRSALRRDGSPADLLVYDWDLPGLSGAELLPQLREMGLSGTAVLFCVSRAQRPLVPHAVREAPSDCIERPFTEEAFAAKLRGLGAAIGPRKRPESSGSHPAIAPLPEVDRHAPFLQQIDARLAGDLLKLARPGVHDAGQVLLRAGERCASLHLVIDGRAEVLEGAAGRRTRTIETGDSYGELSFMTDQPSPETVRALTAIRTASLSRPNLADFLRSHPTFAGTLTALVGRHKRELVARATTLEHSDFKGTFDTFPFADVMQMLISTRKTGVLGLRSDVDHGAVYLEGGEAVHAWTERLTGEEAFLELAGWSAAKFAFTSIKRQEPRTLLSPTITLLMRTIGSAR